MKKRMYTAPTDENRCKANAKTAVKGEGARCMRRRSADSDFCSVHLKEQK